MDRDLDQPIADKFFKQAVKDAARDAATMPEAWHTRPWLSCVIVLAFGIAAGVVLVSVVRPSQCEESAGWLRTPDGISNELRCGSTQRLEVVSHVMLNGSEALYATCRCPRED